MRSHVLLLVISCYESATAITIICIIFVTTVTLAFTTFIE